MRGVRNRFDQSASVYRRRNAEDDVVLSDRLLEIGLFGVAAGSISPSRDGEDVMHAAIGMAQVGSQRKAHFAHGAIGRDERRYLVCRSLVDGNRNLGIDGGTASAHRWRSVTLSTAFGIESWSKSEARSGHGALHGIDFVEVRQSGCEKSLLIWCKACDESAGAWRSAAYSRIACSAIASLL